MTGIPDPGAASKAVAMVVAGASPFDAIRIVSPESREYWSGRDLMEFFGYSQWRDFANAISRARAAAHNSGHDASQHFASARKVAASGPAAEDFHLSRYGAYLVAMNADSCKARVAEAQTYFAIRTRESEVLSASTPPASSAVMPTHSEALRGWAADQRERSAGRVRGAAGGGAAAGFGDAGEQLRGAVVTSSLIAVAAAVLALGFLAEVLYLFPRRRP